MPTQAIYKTTLHQINIPGLSPLDIHTLKDRQQFFDPSGAADRLGICSAAWPLFGMLWPSGVKLAHKMAKRPVIAGERILEIGCGLALASLAAHQRGADITASDRHPMAYHFLRKNLATNQLPLMAYRHGQWGTTNKACINDTAAPHLLERYDMIIGSDLLYDPSGPIDVAAFVDQYAAAKAEVWIMDPNRGYRNRFSRHMADYGFYLAHDNKIQNSFALTAAEDAQPYSGRLLVYKRDIAPLSIV